MENTASPAARRVRLLVHFLWVLLVARVITGLTISHDLFDAHAWLLPATWVPALGFAIILTAVHWRNQRTA